jgi:hypothetical protein
MYKKWKQWKIYQFFHNQSHEVGIKASSGNVVCSLQTITYFRHEAVTNTMLIESDIVVSSIGLLLIIYIGKAA